MKNVDWIFLLICLFITRIIMLSASFPDSICLIALLGYRYAAQYIEARKLSADVLKAVEDSRDEVKRTRDSVDMLKLSAGFGGIKRG